MNYNIEPIRDKNLINEIYKYLKDKEMKHVAKMRDYVILYIGFNTGLRVSDILRLQAYQFNDSSEYLYIKEKKTKKPRRIKIYKHLRKVVKEYILLNKLFGDLFPARYTHKNICSKTAYMIFKDIEKQFDLKMLATHSMRKTFGYHYYKKTRDVVTLMKIFNHSDPDITLDYIGIDQDEIDDSLKDFKI